MADSGKGIVMLAIDCDTTRIVYHALTRGGIAVDRIILEQPVAKKTLVKGRIRKLGWWKVLGQLAFMALVSPIIKRSSRRRHTAIMQSYGLLDAPLPEEKITRVSSVNSEDCREALRVTGGALILVNGTRIISKKTLSATSLPFINIHTGITPLFRGVHGGYWAIATGQPQLFGTTIHRVDAGIDTGAVLEQITALPSHEDSFATFPLLQYAVCLPALIDIIHRFISTGELLPRQPLTTQSALRYHPTIWQWLALPRSVRK